MLSFPAGAAVPCAATLLLWPGGAEGVAVVNLWLCCFALVPAAAGEAPLRGGAQGVVVVMWLCCFASCLLVLCPAPGPAAAGMCQACYACALGSLGFAPLQLGWGCVLRDRGFKRALARVASRPLYAVGLPHFDKMGNS